jgi:hypothetical protein
MSPCVVSLSDNAKPISKENGGVARSAAAQNATHDSEMHKGAAKQSAEDWVVLRGAEAELRTRFSKSFSASDIKQVECRAWQDYRERHPEGKLDLDSFSAYAADNYGGLRVRSRPEGAAIVVDTKPWDGPTDSQNMCSIGTRHIVLSKPGYYDEAGDAIVKHGELTIFQRDLKPRP